jgi:phenylacetate-CoA ligase
LREQVAYLARRSRFYQAKFAEHGIDLTSIRTVDDLDGLPFTEKQELRDSLTEAPPLGRHIAAADGEIVQIQASSGTTGSPSYVGLTASDIETWCELGARALYANGFRPGDRLLHGFGMSKGFVGGLPMVQIAQYMGILDIPIGAEAGAERLLRVQADQRSNLLVGTPHFLAYLAEQAPAIVGCKPTSSVSGR